MNGRVSNAHTPRSLPEPSTASHELALVLYMSGDRHFLSSGTGLGSGGLARDEPLHSTKRRLDTTSEPHPSPAVKRARLEETGAQQLGTEDEESEKAAKVCHNISSLQVNR